MGRDTPGPNGSVRARRHAACRAGAEKRRREREATGASNASPVARHEEDERRARHLMCTEGGTQPPAAAAVAPRGSASAGPRRADRPRHAEHIHNSRCNARLPCMQHTASHRGRGRPLGLHSSCYDERLPCRQHTAAHKG